MNIYLEIDKLVHNMEESIDKYGVEAIGAGNNGPYYDMETNIRNLAHWCVTFAEYYLHTKKERYRNFVVLLADAIINSKEYNQNGVYKCRESIGKDEINGVIGPAWIIEGLIYATRVTGDEKYYNRAKDLFLAVPINKKLGLWNRRDTAGNILSVDATFNHQLWFAAAGAMIDNYRHNEEIWNRVKLFIDSIEKNITIKTNGRIGHFTLNDKKIMLNGLVLMYKNLKSDIAEMFGKPSLAYKENGYHLFNLYGFAILSDNSRTSIPFLHTQKFSKAVNYIMSEEFIKSLCLEKHSMDSTHVNSQLNVDFNVFAFSYNAPGFEIDRVKNAFEEFADDGMEEIKAVLHAKQLEYTYDYVSTKFCVNTDDSNTLCTRVYEAIASNSDYWKNMN